ncbi:MAG: hypothetical protein AAB612_02800 [Patescibacteria group bacterium]
MRPRLPWSLIILTIIGCIVIANIGFLDYVYFSSKSVGIKIQQKVQTPLPVTTEPKGSMCSPSCITAIENATASSTVTTSISQQISSKTPAKTTSLPKDYFIPLGTGFTQNNNWVDVGGTNITINPADYGKIKQVIFQASMHIPVANGTIYARLYNVTDDHPVWYSEVSTGEGASILVSSANITLDSGSKLYRVQIKTSLQYPSYLDFSRIKITIQ